MLINFFASSTSRVKASAGKAGTY